MANRSFALASWTPVAVGDNLVFTDNGYQGLMGGSTTQRCIIKEVMMTGQAATSAPCIMLFGRDSTVQASPTALTTGQYDQSLDPATAALAAPAVAFTASTTKPKRSTTLGALLNLSFNAFGGYTRWTPGPDEEISLLGNTASFGELSLSHYTGGTPGLMGSHIVYEPR